VPKSSIRVSIDALLLERIDRSARTGRFRRRNEFIQLAVEEKLARFRRERLAAECAKLDPDEERAMAEEGLPGVIEPYCSPHG
jgi:Arc/MetJ-type ribon-helix-helix transcriptional regulator